MNKSMQLVFFIITIESFIAIGLLASERFLHGSLFQNSIIGIAFSLSIIIPLMLYSSSIVYKLNKLSILLDEISAKQWVFVVVVIGIIIRLVWVLSYPTPQVSDSAAYFNLAKGLYDNGVYGISNSRSYWPPGYPMFLYSLFLIAGAKTWVYIVINNILYIGTIFVTYLLAAHVSNERVAKLATLFLLFWPGYFSLAGLASKEMLLIFLIPTLLFSYLRAIRVKGKLQLLIYFLTGCLQGYITLVQPAFVLFPLIFIAYELINRTKIKKIAFRIIFIGIGIVFVISPWTIRNYFIFDAIVPVTTNGGSGLYRANNSLATGGYVKSGEIDLSQLSELEQNREGYKLAIEWISENPFNFFKLSIRKTILFTGDDAYGVYETLKRGMEISDIRYIFGKALANLYWLIIWCLIFLFLWRNLKKGIPIPEKMILLFFSFLYLFFIHAIFESSPKYHLPVIASLSIFASSFLLTPGTGSEIKKQT